MKFGGAFLAIGGSFNVNLIFFTAATWIVLLIAWYDGAPQNVIFG